MDDAGASNIVSHDTSEIGTPSPIPLAPAPAPSPVPSVVPVPPSITARIDMQALVAADDPPDRNPVVASPVDDVTFDLG